MAELDDKVIVTKNKITTIADTIREEGGTSDLMTLDEMPDNIRAIAGGGSADVKRLGITLANNTATFNLNGYEIWQLIGSNKTIVADITYTDGNNSTSYNKSCTASLKSEASDTQTRIEASVMIYKNYTFYTRYFNMVIGASSMEYTGTYAVTDIVIPEEQYVDPLFTLTYPSTITCNKTFAQISSYYGAGNTKPVAPQLIYKHSSGDDTAFRSVYGEVEQYDEDTFIFTFNMGYARGVGKTQWQEKIVEIQYERGDSLSKIADYTLEYQKPVVAGDGIELENVGTGINRKSKISVDSSMIMIGNASGSVASFIDGGNDIPLKSCMVAIEPVQSGSGDPSPSNVRPITGWTECKVTRCGTNLFDKDNAENGYIDDATGEVNAGGGDSKNTGYIKVVPSSSLYIVSEQTSGMWGAFYDKNKHYISGVTGYVNSKINVPNNAYYMRLTVRYSGSGNVNTFAINSPSTDTSYHAYNGNTYNIEFPSQAGTVYGGTLDVTNGVLTVDRVMVDMGDLNWGLYSDDNTNHSFVVVCSNDVKPVANDFTLANLICENYKASTFDTTILWKEKDNVVCQVPSVQRWIVRDSTYSDATSFTTAMDGVKLVYEVATPITYQLTPTEIKILLGINNIFADCGDVDVEYVRDATLIINKLLELVSGNNNRTMMKSAVVEKTDEVQEQKKDSVEKASELDA